MFGGKWMDIFVDKLSQKLTAQEMIKANTAADAAELQKTRGQVTQYEALLKEMREISAMNAQSAKQVNTLTAESLSKLENADKVNQLIDASLAKIEEIKANVENTEQLNQQLGELHAAIKEMYAHIDELTEHVHKENVKVYRNVQAVVVEENAKLSEIGSANASAVKKVSGKANAAVALSIVTLIVTVATLTLQILTYFNMI